MSCFLSLGHHNVSVWTDLCPHNMSITTTHTELVSAPCAPCWLLVHSNKSGVEAQHWQILTVLHLISGCSIQMKVQGDGLEHNDRMSATRIMLSARHGPTEHWLAVYASIYGLSVCDWHATLLMEIIDLERVWGEAGERNKRFTKQQSSPHTQVVISIIPFNY